MRRATRGSRKSWPYLLGFGLLSVGAWGAYLLTRAPEPEPKLVRAAPSAPVAPLDDDTTRLVRELASDKGPASTEKLIRLYAELAGKPDALAVRKLAWDALLSDPNLGNKLKNALEAIDRDKTPREDDPLWSNAVESIASLWNNDTVKKGRDLLFTEKRVRPHQLVLDSLIALSGSSLGEALSPAERTRLTNDFIDVYHKPTTSPVDRAGIEEALRDLGQGEVASALDPTEEFGKNSKHPAILEYLRQLDQAERELGIKPK